MEESNTDYNLSEELENTMMPELASPTQRLLNYIIDNLVMRLAITYFTSTFVVYAVATINQEWFDTNIVAGKEIPILFLTALMGVVNYLIYYSLSEGLLNGHTLGKLVTGTRVIKDNGNPIQFKDALIRSLLRLIPFEPLSALGPEAYPWHDRWSKTIVVKIR